MPVNQRGGAEDVFCAFDVVCGIYVWGGRGGEWEVGGQGDGEGGD